MPASTVVAHPPGRPESQESPRGVDALLRRTRSSFLTGDSSLATCSKRSEQFAATRHAHRLRENVQRSGRREASPPELRRRSRPGSAATSEQDWRRCPNVATQVAQTEFCPAALARTWFPGPLFRIKRRRWHFIPAEQYMKK